MRMRCGAHSWSNTGRRAEAPAGRTVTLSKRSATTQDVRPAGEAEQPSAAQHRRRYRNHVGKRAGIEARRRVVTRDGWVEQPRPGVVVTPLAQERDGAVRVSGGRRVQKALAVVILLGRSIPDRNDAVLPRRKDEVVNVLELVTPVQWVGDHATELSGGENGRSDERTVAPIEDAHRDVRLQSVAQAVERTEAGDGDLLGDIKVEPKRAVPRLVSRRAE